MLKVALKGLLGRKLRASLTAIAIVLGVAMVSGTFVITDTINGAFDSIFAQSYKNADAIITGKTAFENVNGNGVQAPSFSESLLPKIKALPDVNGAAGGVTDDQMKLVGRDGKAISTHGTRVTRPARMILRTTGAASTTTRWMSEASAFVSSSRARSRSRRAENARASVSSFATGSGNSSASAISDGACRASTRRSPSP